MIILSLIATILTLIWFAKDPSLFRAFVALGSFGMDLWVVAGCLS